MGDRLNPELLMAAAKLTMPDEDWHIGPMGLPRFWAFRGDKTGRYFNPIEVPGTTHRLMLALMKEHQWEFFFFGRLWHADKLRTSDKGLTTTQANESFAMLLLECVAHQTGIKMYVEGE